MNNNNYYYGNSSSRKINTTNDNMQKLCHEAMRIANERMLYCPDFGISDGLRSAQEQNERFKVGRDQSGKVLYAGLIITNRDGFENISDHQLGNAIDFFAVHPETGKADYSLEAMLAVYSCFSEAAFRLKLTLEWGGNYSTFEDLGHVAIKYK